MLISARPALSLLVAAAVSTAGFAQISQVTDGSAVDGVYLIKKIVTDQALLAAENVDTKVELSAAFTFDPLPAASKKKGKKGKKKSPPPAKPPQEAKPPKKVAPSHDCKAWMVHVNWSPRVGDKMKLADAGECRLRGSFAGR